MPSALLHLRLRLHCGGTVTSCPSITVTLPPPNESRLRNYGLSPVAHQWRQLRGSRQSLTSSPVHRPFSSPLKNRRVASPLLFLFHPQLPGALRISTS